MKIYAERKVSAKSKVSYVGLFIDYGYRKAMISADTAIIAELADMTIRQLNELEVDKPHFIGEIIIK